MGARVASPSVSEAQPPAEDPVRPEQRGGEGRFSRLWGRRSSAAEPSETDPTEAASSGEDPFFADLGHELADEYFGAREGRADLDEDHGDRPHASGTAVWDDELQARLVADALTAETSIVSLDGAPDGAPGRGLWDDHSAAEPNDLALDGAEEVGDELEEDDEFEDEFDENDENLTDEADDGFEDEDLDEFEDEVQDDGFEDDGLDEDEVDDEVQDDEFEDLDDEFDDVDELADEEGELADEEDDKFDDQDEDLEDDEEDEDQEGDLDEEDEYAVEEQEQDLDESNFDEDQDDEAEADASPVPVLEASDDPWNDDSSFDIEHLWGTDGESDDDVVIDLSSNADEYRDLESLNSNKDPAEDFDALLGGEDGEEFDEDFDDLLGDDDLDDDLLGDDLLGDDPASGAARARDTAADIYRPARDRPTTIVPDAAIDTWVRSAGGSDDWMDSARRGTKTTILFLVLALAAVVGVAIAVSVGFTR